MSELVRFLSGDNDVAQKTQMDPQNPTAKFVPLEPGQVLFGLEVVEDGSLLGTIYYDYKDKNGIITRVSMGNGGAGGSGGGGGIIKTLATTDGKHESDEVTATANTIIPLPKKIFANLLSAKTQFNFPKVHDPSNTAYVNEDAAPGQSYLYGNGLHMINPFNTLQDSWIRTIGKSGSAEATLELAMRDNASNEYIYDQIVARHYKADGTIVTDTDGHKREVVILGKEGESQFPGPVTSQRGFVGDVDGNAKSATKAKQDWYDQVIDSTYLSKIVKTTHNGSKFEITSYDGRYTPVGSADAKKDVITIPGATTTLAGLVTTGDQTITGNKTINSSGTLTIIKQGGFIYSGIQEDKATDKNLPIWFSTGTANGTPNYSTELTYNPSTGTVTAKKFAGPATSATYDAEGGAIHDKYLKRAGGTMTGALKFADNIYNAFGDDVEIGSQNAAGKLNIHGKNGATGIVFVPYSGSTSQTISIDGAGVMTITGTVKTTLKGNADTATKLKTARNFNITDSSAAYSGPNVSFDGSADITLHMPDTFAGTLKGNSDTATKLKTARTLWGQSFNGTANISGNMTGVGNVTSTKTNTYTLGTSSNLWKAVYATTFYGALSGNASTATTLQTARNLHITDSSATYNGPNASFNGSADITLHMPSTFTGHLKGNADNDGNGVNIASNYMRSEAVTGDIDRMQVVLAGKTGRTGSISLTKKDSGTGSQVPAGWYNYVFSPHRTGIGGDNDSYGTTLIFPMTFSGNSYIVRRSSSKDAATEVKMIIDSGNIGKQSVDNADKVDGYHASSLWRSDGAVWNPGANVSMTGAANGQEWSFDIHKGGMTGLYWQVWEDSKATLLKVDADTGKVSAPYGFVGALTGNASSATKLLTNGTHVEAASNNDTSTWVSKNGMLYTSGMYMTETYNDANTPVNFGNIINLAGRGAGQLLLEWTSGAPATGHIYYRDQRDCAGSGDWHSWQKVAFVTDNVASATKWATARNFQVDLALDNPATVKVDGTKDVILPVTGILATKHGGTGQSSHTANRLVWSETATKLSATNNHYASASQIAVNSTSAPTGYTFLVNGKTHLNGDARVTGNLLMTNGGSSIYWDNGTVQQRIITTDDSTADTAVFAFQQSENTASSWNNLLTIRDNGRIVLQNEKGGIYKLVTTANTSPLIQLVSDNQDVSIFKVASGTSIIDSWSCGFDLIYKGTGAGIDNLLTLYAGDYHNTGTKVIGWSVNQAGQMGIKTTPSSSYSLNINGNTYSNGKFYINNTTDVTTSNKDGVVVIGPKDGLNLGIDNDEIMARNATAVSTLYLNRDGGLVQIGSGGLYVTGQMKTNGPLLIGSDANGRTKNYIAFYGITGDGPDTWNHTFIGENLFGDTDKSELILFKGNDPGSTPEDMRYASGPGPDRIRHIAAGHLFQIYRTALSGTFATIAQSTVPISIFEVNQQGVVVYNEGTDANNYPAKITFRVKDTINGTTSTATIAAYSDHGTASYGSNLVISSGGNTLIQAGDGTYGSYANLIGTGVNQGENLYLTADGSIQLCAIADTANRKLIWDGTTFYPSISNTFHLGSKSYRWASAHVYRDFNIYGTGSTSDESHVRFNASDNSQRAIIAFNGNTTNTLDATTHLKIATNYGDIRLDAASNYINVKGHILPRADFTATNYNIGSTTRRWGNVYANALRLQGPSSDPSEAQGARIEFAYDNGKNRSQPVYISYTPNDGYRAPYGLKIFGTEAANYGAWLEVQGAIGTSNTNASSGIGLSLYGGPVNGKPTYGMFFGGTATFGKLYNTTSSTYGVSSDWATYFTTSDTTNRGWLFMRGATNVAGVTGNGTFLSVVSTGTHIAGNQGKVIIDGTAGAGYNMLFRQKSTNGVFTGGAWNAEWNLFYTANATITAGTNSTTYSIRLINEAGNTKLNRLGINGENTSYQLYVNGTSLFASTLTANGQIVSKVAAGTPPFVITSNTVSANLNADLLDGWHKQDVLGTYCVQSATASLSHYWCKIWSATIKNQQYNDIGISIYVQSQYNNKYGMFTWKLRQSGANNSGAYNFTTALQEHFGNIAASDIRLYYNNATGLCEVWVNCWSQYGAWNYSVLKKCYRTAQDSTAIGTFYNTNFTTAQTLPTSSYIAASYTPFLGNAATATALTTSAGSTGQPVYFASGKPVAIDWHIGNSGVGEHNANNVTYNFCGYYTSNGPATSLGASTNDGALYAQAYNSAWVGQIAQDYRNGGLYVRGKNNGTWQSWYKVLDTRNYAGTLDGRYVLKSDLGNTTFKVTRGASMSTATAGYWAAMVNPSEAGSPICPSSGWWHVLSMDWSGNDPNNWISQLALPTQGSGTKNVYFRYNNSGSTSINSGTWRMLWKQGDAVTSAVWNDYAECRKSDSQEPGYVMFEKGNDSLSKTFERLQHFAGIVSDTWGFSQGETADAKTNIAVAGRVLAYPYRDRNEYKPGDCVCAAPGGKVDIMTREEIAQYPDRIVGTVSCVPEYETWGGGELADRDPVKVNGRIWIKVR